MIAGAGSGSGKTLITCAMLEVLRRKGKKPGACKCGPDYIDPMFHRRVQGVDSGNLDSFFMDQDAIRQALCRHSDGYVVIEGVMGIYDGMAVDDLRGSCYEIAELTDTPVLLIVDASGRGRTVISVIKGILSDDRAKLIRGLILNRISEDFYTKLLPVLKRELYAAGFGYVKLLGGLPRTESMTIKSRHLGLLMPYEIEDLKEKINRFADVMEKRCELADILTMMEEAAALPTADAQATDTYAPCKARAPVIAVARDEAFCFYYEENIEALRKAGARIAFFSPLRDQTLPEETAGIVLGGGYPELYLDDLSANSTMLRSIREAIDSGMPSIAECGGFMYLHRTIRDQENRAYETVGAIEGECFYTGHLVRFGYLRLAAGDKGSPEAFGTVLNGIRGHEFHYYDSTNQGESCMAVKPVSGNQWRCMICDDHRMWGYPHLYYPSCEGLAGGFIKAAREYHGEFREIFCQ